MVKGFIGLYTHLLWDENLHVNGLDFDGFGLKHQTYWGVDDIKSTMTMFQVRSNDIMTSIHFHEGVVINYRCEEAKNLRRV